VLKVWVEIYLDLLPRERPRCTCTREERLIVAQLELVRYSHIFEFKVVVSHHRFKEVIAVVSEQGFKEFVAVVSLQGFNECIQ
jgi:hypothetical protein